MIKNIETCTPQDALKFIYQKTMGNGHLLSNANNCIASLEKERQSFSKTTDIPFTFLGNGFCRLHLNNLQVNELSNSTLYNMMTYSQKFFTPNKLEFIKHIDWLKEQSVQSNLDFSLNELQEFLSKYNLERCPPFSHSEKYKQLVNPSYRVVLSDFGQFLPFIVEIEKKVLSQQPIIIVIDGDCGGGKSTFASHLTALYNAQIIQMDSFFLPPNLRTENRLLLSGGNIDYKRFIEQVLNPLCKGQSTNINYQQYNCKTGQYITQELPFSNVIIIEGSYALHPKFLPYYNKLNTLTCFIKVSLENQHKRLQKRNPSLFPQFIEKWIPMEKQYHQAYSISENVNFLLYSRSWESNKGDLFYV